MFINRIFEWLMFGGTMMFAAGSSAVGGGGGTGVSAPPGGTGTGDSGGTGDQGGKSITGGESGQRGTDGADDGLSLGTDAGDDFGDVGDFEDFGDEPEVKADSHEEFGPETYQSLKKALHAQPELFKSVKKAVSMVKRFQEHFETPEAASELLTDLQTHGGWDAVKQEVGETATFLNGFNAGDAEVVNRWLDDNADGLSKNMPTIIKKWQSVDEAGWAHDAAQTFIATMNSAPVGGITALAALSQIGQIEGVKDSEAYQRLVQVIKSVEKVAGQVPQAKPAAPDTTKLSQREQQIKQGEANLYRQGLAGKAAPLEITAAKNAMKIVSKGAKLTPAQSDFVLKKIHNHFAALVAKNKDAGEKRNKLRDAGQTEQWLKMVNSEFRRTMPEAARLAWREYRGITGMSAQQKDQRRAEGQQRREAGSSGTASSTVQTLSPGDGRQVDWDAMRAKFGGRDKADEAFAFGLKNLHGGKRVWIKKGEQNSVYTY